VNFLTDAQLQPALVRWLQAEGHAAQHVAELDLLEAEDPHIWAPALATQAIILTKDEDFAERSARSLTAPTIVWLRIGNATNRALLEWLTPRWAGVVALLQAGERLIEVR
jgi:predicted nuclease of predicted toxin-antitoxin system